MNVKIRYNGQFPNLCAGDLIVEIRINEWKTEIWTFPDSCLTFGGNVWFDADWIEQVDTGEWIIAEYPPNFPKEWEAMVRDAVNAQIEPGCCGGCI